LFEKVLIANRGAIARRVVRACNELGVPSVAVYSDADVDAPHLAEASETIALPGNRAQDTYLNLPALMAALKTSGADSVHPGYGFLSENAEFAEAVAANGAQFIGPSARFLRSLGDKVAAREALAKAGFPVFPGSGRLPDLGTAERVAEELGYPLMLKPVAGGGGIGMRVVRDRNELGAGFDVCRALAERSCGDPAVYFEAFLERPRHIELQLLGDQHGQVIALHERDCSVQRRQQKLIEEAPAPGIVRSQVAQLAERAVTVMQGMGCDSVATLETLRRADGEWGFLELNPRIQVEHGVTEEVTGLDLVGWQIRVAAGERVPVAPKLTGHALEVRVYAENPLTGLPDTGKLLTFRLPQMHGVRVESGFAEGQTVTPYYDPLLAKLIGWGTTREQAIGRALVGLRGMTVRGVRTNISTLMQTLQHPTFIAGRVHTGLLAQIANERR
jgi:acetyl-CoA carboxylase biotin carboxylase subunit